MVEKLASTEIAQSREECLADRWAGEFYSTTYGMRPDKTHSAYKAARVCLMAMYEAAERDTRERIAQFIENAMITEGFRKTQIYTEAEQEVDKYFKLLAGCIRGKV